MQITLFIGVLFLALAGVGSSRDNEYHKRQSYQQQLRQYYQKQRLYEQQKQQQLHQMQLARHKLHLQQNTLSRHTQYVRPPPPPPPAVYTIAHTGDLQRALYRGETWLVLIYAPWCGHSRRAIKEWQNVAAESGRIRSRNITVAAFDVKAFSFYPVPNTLYSRYIPTVRLFTPEHPSGVEYDGRVTTENVIRWTYHELHRMSAHQSRRENE